MTPIVRRLKTRQQFLKVAATRQKWVAPGLILQCRRRLEGGGRPQDSLRQDSLRSDLAAVPPLPVDGSGSGYMGLGFTVSRKVGNAVQRNRARRRLRAASDIVLPEKGREGYDYVLIGRKETLTRDFRHLMGDLKTALERIDRGSASKTRSKKTSARNRRSVLS